MVEFNFYLFIQCVIADLPGTEHECSATEKPNGEILTVSVALIHFRLLVLREAHNIDITQYRFWTIIGRTWFNRPTITSRVFGAKSLPSVIISVFSMNTLRPIYAVLTLSHLLPCSSPISVSPVFFSVIFLPSPPGFWCPAIFAWNRFTRSIIIMAGRSAVSHGNVRRDGKRGLSWERKGHEQCTFSRFTTYVVTGIRSRPLNVNRSLSAIAIPQIPTRFVVVVIIQVYNAKNGLFPSKRQTTFFRSFVYERIS